MIPFKSFQLFGKVNVLALSHDGGMLAAGTATGTIRVWSTKSWDVLDDIFDENEEALEEIYVLKFTDDDKGLLFGGKKKHRYEWDFDDADHKIVSNFLIFPFLIRFII